MPPVARIDPEALFDTPRPVVGMIHLLPLPGSPDWAGSMAEVEDRALSDARALAEGGVDGLLMENFGDAPFHPGRVPPETTAALARVGAAVAAAHRLPLGINVLRNDARAALGVAAAVGARFIRVNVHTGTMLTDQGRLEGRAHETLRTRRALELDAAILADVLVKHAAPPPGVDVASAARDAWDRGRADALVVSGPATGRALHPARIREVRDGAPDAPVWVGSGLTAESAERLLTAADGAVVGSALQAGGRAGAGVEPDRVRRLMDAVDRVREG